MRPATSLPSSHLPCRISCCSFTLRHVDLLLAPQTYQAAPALACSLGWALCMELFPQTASWLTPSPPSNLGLHLFFSLRSRLSSSFHAATLPCSIWFTHLFKFFKNVFERQRDRNKQVENENEGAERGQENASFC